MSGNRSDGRSGNWLAVREEKGMVIGSEIDAILTTVRMFIIGCIVWEIDASNKIQTMRTI